MSLLQPLLTLLEQQEQLQQQLLQRAREIDAQDLVSQNVSLHRQVEELERERQQLEQHRRALEGDNLKLRTALAGQMYARRDNLLGASRRRLEGEYYKLLDREGKRLEQLHSSVEHSLALLEREAVTKLEHDREDFAQQLQALREQLNATLAAQRAAQQARSAPLLQQLEGDYAALEQQPIAEEAMRKKAERDNVEFRLGSRIANLLGVLLILLGVIYGLQYSYTHFLTSNALKSAAAFLLGTGFLAAGELLNRKRSSVFSLGITSGGIAILFASTVLSHMVLEVLTRSTAFLVCMLIAAAALLLSRRYRSQTVANFALVGGFLPLYAVTFDNVGMLYTVMAYLLVLNLFALLVSLEQNWQSVKLVSFVVNTIGTGLIVLYGNGNELLNLVYAVLTFALYVFIAVIYPMRKQQPIDEISFYMIILNTLCNVGFLFGILGRGKLDDYMGALALGLAAFYYLFSGYLQKHLKDLRLPGIYLAASLVFAVLVVPLQFEVEWLSMGWLLEATALLLIGLRTKEKWYLRIGGGTYVLSLGAFVFFDWGVEYILLSGLTLSGYGPILPLFFLKLTALVAMTLLVGAAALRAYSDRPGILESPAGLPLRLGKYYALLLVYFYLSYAMQFVLRYFELSHSYADWSLLKALLDTGFAILLLRAPRLRDRVTDLFTMLLQAAVILRTLAGNAGLISYAAQGRLLPRPVVMLLLNAAGFFAMWMFLTRLIERRRLSPQVHPVVLFGYVLLSVWLILTQQYNVAFNSMLLSLLLAAAALAYILHGFGTRSHYTRRVGLGLSVVAVVKLFLVDLYFLTDWQRILSFFGLGATLLAISYFYQFFSKRVFDLDDIQLEPPAWHRVTQDREQLQQLTDEALASGRRSWFGGGKKERQPKESRRARRQRQKQEPAQQELDAPPAPPTAPHREEDLHEPMD